MSNLFPSFYSFLTAHRSANGATLSVKKTVQAGLLSSIFGLMVVSFNASAEQTEACKPQWITEPLEVTSKKTIGPTELQADELVQPHANLYELHGSVVITQPGMVILADKIQFQRDTEKTDAFGQVEVHQTDLIIQAKEAHIDNQQKTAELLDTQYQMKPSRTHGEAKRVAVDQNKEVATLERATLTTCPVQKFTRQIQTENNETRTITDEKVAWQLSFDDVKIDQSTRRVIGKHTTLKFHNVPVFYSPYFDFPLDDRASGLLFPEFGGYKALTDSKTRLHYSQPYYFNIAPNYDDTLTAIYLENRGLILENEFRYLQKTGDVTHQAALTLTALNDNETATNGLAYLDGDDVVYGETIEQRWRGKLAANQNWAPGLTSRVLWHETSDENFFADIPVEEQYKTVTNTQRYIKADYRIDNWHSYAQFLSYLPLRNAPINYEKRPEIGVTYNQNYGDLRFDLTAEATEFDIPVSDHTKPEAMRARLVPELSYEINKSYGHLKANIIANHLRYSLHDNGNNTTGESNLNHTVMQYALNSGLIFERNFSVAGNNFIQTLEPELQYLVVPYVDQSNVPLFDTSNKSLAFSNLFALNRFTGYDRIGDTKQITAALTSKILTESGKPLLEAGLGQILYLQDRDVTLSNTDPVITEQSDYFVKLGVTTKNLYFSSTSQFSQENTALINANSRIRWNFTKSSKLLLNHILTNNELPGEKDTLAVGATIKLNDRWEAGTYWNYDFTNNVRNEVQHAIRYDDCCWAGELSVEETQLENGLYNYNFQFLVEFKGLSTSGNSFQNYLKNKLNF
ncbi:MAG: LPS assembly protein LptD [Pseudomonadota bacterium]|nr:LPS assembly protein LptD [Pseudomonadota bacterium]